MIRANAHKYPIYKMCKLLGISRSSYYAYQEPEPSGDPVGPFVVKIFHENHRVYGTQKLKVELEKLGYCVSRRRIGRIMAKNGLISVYAVKKYRYKSTVNYEDVPNLVN